MAHVARAIQACFKIVCPRKHAVVHFGGQFADEIKARPDGAAPEVDEEGLGVEGGRV